MICEDTPQIDIRGFLPTGHDIQALGVELSVYRTPCNYGGYRYYFRCPGCERNCCILYRVGRFIRCRICAKLRYRSELRSPKERRRKKALSIRRSLGQTRGGFAVPFPSKPKYMHWKKYNRLKEECRELEAEYRRDLKALLVHLQSQVKAR